MNKYMIIRESGFAPPIDGAKMEYTFETFVCDENTTIKEIQEAFRIKENYFPNLTITKSRESTK